MGIGGPEDDGCATAFTFGDCRSEHRARRGLLLRTEDSNNDFLYIAQNPMNSGTTIAITTKRINARMFVTHLCHGGAIVNAKMCYTHVSNEIQLHFDTCKACS